MSSSSKGPGAGLVKSRPSTGGEYDPVALTLEEVRLGYLFVLGREPESDAVCAAHRGHADVSAFRAALMASPEGRSRLRMPAAVSVEHPALSFGRPTVCHIHVEKTGGTSLQRMLASAFEPSRVSPVHAFDLHHLSLAELGRYDLVSGHFDYATSLLLPRARVRRVCVLREPVDRLLSFYRFHRAHPPSMFRENVFVRLASDLSPVEFFRHPDVVASPRLNNAYFRVFGTSLQHPAEDLAQARGAVWDEAVRRLRTLDGLGLTERLELSSRVIFAALGLVAPVSLQSLHRTEDLASVHPSFRAPPAVDLTPALRQVLEPLVRLDRELYAIASAEFASRTVSTSPDTAHPTAYLLTG